MAISFSSKHAFSRQSATAVQLAQNTPGLAQTAARVSSKRLDFAPVDSSIVGRDDHDIAERNRPLFSLAIYPSGVAGQNRLKEFADSLRLFGRAVLVAATRYPTLTITAMPFIAAEDALAGILKQAETTPDFNWQPLVGCRAQPDEQHSDNVSCDDPLTN